MGTDTARVGRIAASMSLGVVAIALGAQVGPVYESLGPRLHLLGSAVALVIAAARKHAARAAA